MPELTQEERVGAEPGPADGAAGRTGVTGMATEAGTGRAEQVLEAEAVAASAHALRVLAVPEVEIEGHLEALVRIRAWTGRPLWEMTAVQADAYFGEHVRVEDFDLRVAQAQALARYFVFLAGEQGAGLLADRALEPVRCPLDALNWPIPPGQSRVGPPWRRGRRARSVPDESAPG